MNLKEAQERLSKDRKYRQQYEKLGDRVAIAMHLVAIRKELKLTKAVLAREMGLYVSQISRVENLAPSANSLVTALLVDRFQSELRRRGVPIEHWMPVAQEAKRLAREKAEQTKRRQEKPGIILLRDRGTRTSSLYNELSDESRINIIEESEVQFWSQRFGVNRRRLIEAVKRVGTSAEAVRKELEKNP
jgi:hypothetical protein